MAEVRIRDGLIRAGVGHRLRILRGDGDGVGDAGFRAIVDDELDHIVARLVHREGGVDRRRIGQRGRAPGGSGRERPGEGECIAIHIAGGAAVEVYQVSHENRLIGSGIRHRLGIDRGNGDRVRLAGQFAVPDDQLYDVLAGLVHREGGLDRRRVGQRRPRSPQVST